MNIKLIPNEKKPMISPTNYIGHKLLKEDIPELGETEKPPTTISRPTNYSFIRGYNVSLFNAGLHFRAGTSDGFSSFEAGQYLRYRIVDEMFPVIYYYAEFNFTYSKIKYMNNIIPYKGWGIIPIKFTLDMAAFTLGLSAYYDDFWGYKDTFRNNLKPSDYGIGFNLNFKWIGIYYKRSLSDFSKLDGFLTRDAIYFNLMLNIY